MVQNKSKTHAVLVQIDVSDTFIFADIFDEERYKIIRESDVVDNLILPSLEHFRALNPKIKTWKEWVENAEDGGYEVEIIYKNSSLWRASIALLGEGIENALRLSLKYHGGRERKSGVDTDMTHLLDVAFLLYTQDRFHPDPEMIAAALCHDLLEDTLCKEGEIKSAVGEEALRIVLACSHDKSLEGDSDWEKRKKKYVSSVEGGGEKAMLVSLADKVANARSLLALYQLKGVEMWNCFNRGKEKKIWFENEMYVMFKRYLAGHPLLEEYRKLIQEIEKLPGETLH